MLSVFSSMKLALAPMRKPVNGMMKPSRSTPRSDRLPALITSSAPDGSLIVLQSPSGLNGGCSTINDPRSEEHTSELQSLMRISYAVFCLKKKNKKQSDKYE